MKQQEIQYGDVLVVCNYYSKTLRPTNTHIKIVEKHVPRDRYSSRADAVRGYVVEQDENGMWIEQMKEDGERQQRIVRSRDLMTVADVAAMREKEAAAQAERERRQALRDEVKADYDGILAHKLGIPEEHVDTTVMFKTSEDDEIVIHRAVVDPAGVDMVLAESDISGHLGVEDIESILQAISDEGELSLLTPHEIAVRIVGRNGNSEGEDSEGESEEGESDD
jgi:hypothetical protein